MDVQQDRSSAWWQITVNVGLIKNITHLLRNVRLSLKIQLFQQVSVQMISLIGIVLIRCASLALKQLLSLIQHKKNAFLVLLIPLGLPKLKNVSLCVLIITLIMWHWRNACLTFNVMQLNQFLITILKHAKLVLIQLNGTLILKSASVLQALLSMQLHFCAKRYSLSSVMI